MESFETSATVEGEGQVRISGVPFAPGTVVEVSINPKRRSAEEFAAAWQRVCANLRAQPELADISDEDIREEIARHRAGQ